MFVPEKPFQPSVMITLGYWVIGPIHNLQRKLIVVNTTPELVFTKHLTYFLQSIIWMGSLIDKVEWSF
jgi:hypothetical protein